MSFIQSNKKKEPSLQTGGHLDYLFETSSTSNGEETNNNKNEVKTKLGKFAKDNKSDFRNEHMKYKATQLKKEKYPQYGGSTMSKKDGSGSNKATFDVTLPSGLPKKDKKQGSKIAQLVKEKTNIDSNMEKLQSKVDIYDRIYGKDYTTTTTTTKSSSENNEDSGVFGFTKKIGFGSGSSADSHVFNPTVPKPLYLPDSYTEDDDTEEGDVEGEGVEDVAPEDQHDDAFYITQKDYKSVVQTHDSKIQQLKRELESLGKKYSNGESNDDYKTLLQKNTQLDEYLENLNILINKEQTLIESLQMEKIDKDLEFKRLNLLSLKNHKLLKLKHWKSKQKREKKRTVINEKKTKRERENKTVTNKNERRLARNNKIVAQNNETLSKNTTTVAKNKEYAALKKERFTKYGIPFKSKSEHVSLAPKVTEAPKEEAPKEEAPKEEEESDAISNATSYIADADTDDELADEEDNAEKEIETEFQEVSKDSKFPESRKKEYLDNKRVLDNYREEINKLLEQFNSTQREILSLIGKTTVDKDIVDRNNRKVIFLGTLNSNFDQSSDEDLDTLSTISDSSEVDEFIPAKVPVLGKVTPVPEVELDSEPEPSPEPTPEPTPVPTPAPSIRAVAIGGDSAAAAATAAEVQEIDAPVAPVNGADTAKTPMSSVFTTTTIKNTTDLKNTSAKTADVPGTTSQSSLFSEYSEEEIITVPDTVTHA